DSGLERRSRVDNSSGAQRLETVMASQASATQRAGRAGRTSAGACYRLWSEQGHSRRTAHWQPEIHRADLAPLLLELGLWGASGDNDLPWLDAPPSASLSRAEALLNRLGLWKQGQLTPMGRAVAALPVHPRIGYMLVWADNNGAAALACRLAVWLDEQTRGSFGVDLEPLLNQALPSSLQRRADQLARLLKARDSQGKLPSAAVLLAQAYPDWIAQRRSGEPGRFLLACGAGVVINDEDALAHCQWLSVAQLGGGGSQLRIFKAAELNIDELEQYSPELFDNVKHLDWDDKQQRVLAERRRMLGNLVVDTKPLHDISSSDKANALVVGIRHRGVDCLPWNDECREWQARVQRMGELSQHGQESAWPAVDDDALMTHLEEWLLPWLDGVGSIKALQQLDLYKYLNAMLNYRQQVLMDECLPKRYTVPSGSQIRLSYVQTGNPVLSVRLQEMLGCAVNPSVAQGQILLKVELLSPARRPVQVTTDLANFWTNSYPAVKKDMAGRYPKHAWPDDPLAAQPTTHARRRKR
ncbi:MAG: ATP-dependent helicase HrpB, partial [Gammaproteobacteria bacterium]